jgi:DNA-binding LacI/PurR family transcriptional regulator
VRGRLWRYRWVVLGVAVACVGLVVVLLVWPSGGRKLPPPRARVYTQFNACLLTDADGVSGPAAAPVWAGMQAASLKTSGKVSYLSVYGPDTVANAVPYVNTLVQRKCDLVIAVGPTEVAAVRSQATAFPSARFVVVDSGTSSGNVSVVESSPNSAVSSAVQGLVTRAAGA